MVKTQFLALTLGTFLSYPVASDFPLQYVHNEGAKLDSKQRNIVSTWLQSAKVKNNNAIEALNKAECPQDLKKRLDLVKHELDNVGTGSTESPWLDVRRALRKEISAMEAMLNKYKIVKEESCKTKLLVAIYYAMDACFDFVKALTALKSDPVLMRSVTFTTLQLLEKTRQSAQTGNTELPNSVAELARQVLTMTESSSAESQELPKTVS